LANSQEREEIVWKGMLAQQRWHDIIKPMQNILKFRPSWLAGRTQYLAGDVHL
jgi:hypothetical protein